MTSLMALLVELWKAWRRTTNHHLSPNSSPSSDAFAEAVA